MAPRPCRIDGCSKLTGIPGTAKELCSSHYQKLRTYGDPLADRRKVRGRPCAIEDCAAPVVAHDLCSRHYTRLKRHGSVEDPRPWVGLGAGLRWCGRCKTAKPVGDFYPNRSKPSGYDTQCKSCARARRVETYQADLDASRAKSRQWYSASRARRLADARRYRRRHPEKIRANGSVARARKRAALVERFDHCEIFERDGWICQICGKQVDRERAWPHPQSPSLDHIVPLAKGGEHSRRNVQLAHLGCNWHKHTGGTDQLRLIG